ncbi:hypothetical protein AGOR_G00121960 [Albula goreensis]|uniref:DNAX-activation protein 10 n=1 Tax=Albula goreensis TaxID=1534307 RepID=A0A8T3DE75_9TELE|nr:hypothetical protein AGOR_G00121960 [Albula goreensis]
MADMIRALLLLVLTLWAVECQESNYFYVLGKVCENCYELDATLLIGIIVGDLMVTGGIIIFIYNCAQRKAGASPPPSAAGRSTNRNAPSVPDRDYEALNLGTRDNSTYAVAG